MDKCNLGARATASAALIVVAAMAGGCASITKGTSQSITVNTEPTGATCYLSRDGQQIAVVNPTPGTIQVGKGAGTIAVTCKKIGYQDSVGTLASSFQAMTFGNIIFGGIIGVAVDAASGAMHEYPPMVTITMLPEAFASSGDRDAFFDKMKATLLQEADEVRARVKSLCTIDCEAQLRAVDTGTEAKLAEIERLRASARVGGAKPTTP